MSPYFAGPLPVDDFLCKFLPDQPQVMPSFSETMFKSVVDSPDEAGMCDPFTIALNRHLKKLQIYCTSNSEDQGKTDFSIKIKPGCSVFVKDHSFCGTDSFAIELFIEFKQWVDDDPFVLQPRMSSSDNTRPYNPFMKDSDLGRSTCGQITAYATLHMSVQYQTHVFFVLICGYYARLIRWDHSGAIITEPIIYNDSSSLFDFFICFDHALPRVAKPEEIRDAVKAIKEFEELEKSQISMKRSIFMKDSWRLVKEGIPKEGDVYSRFKANAVPNVPHCLNSGDIGKEIYHSTRTDHFVNQNWNPNYVYDLTSHRHYRLILDDIGQPLDSFKCSQDMVRAVYAALTAYESAHNCGILHRDISPGNILITSDKTFEGGLLIDWDLCKDIKSEADGPRRAAHTGTWQFMAADLIMDPTINHTFIHDLESAFYVIFWLSIKFLSNFWDPQQHANVMKELFNPSNITIQKVVWMAVSIRHAHMHSQRTVVALQSTTFPTFGQLDLQLMKPLLFAEKETAEKSSIFLENHKEVILIFKRSLDGYVLNVCMTSTSLCLSYTSHVTTSSCTSPYTTTKPAHTQRHVLVVTSQLDEISSGEDFELADGDNTDDASSQRDQSLPRDMDPLFNPAPSQRTKDTQVPVGETKKRVCKLCT
ncbi:hypothetical protein F5888DRAFT_1633507 [Russula emetica]|nr:hypothetical protein F5888DRAFT_1633507 [Russula emetica]